MSVERLVADIDSELHDLCQPLTVLSCHLELAHWKGDADSLRLAVRDSIVECRRIVQAVTRMRGHLAAMLELHPPNPREDN